MRISASLIWRTLLPGAGLAALLLAALVVFGAEDESGPAAGQTSQPKAAPTADASATAPPRPAAANTFYVSPRGDGSDGRSWQTAWPELDRIDWEAIGPGATILLDGGAEKIVYRTTLVVARSGKEGAPITIRLAAEPGHNGRAVIFGGRSAPLPYCGQGDYEPTGDEVRSVGIAVGDADWIVVDGTKWRGIAIHGHGRSGIDFDGGASDVVVRYVEVYDNGSVSRRGDRWYPEQEGVSLSGTNITFKRAIVHDNGEDAFQASSKLENFTLRESWLYNGRKDPDGDVWNYCKHPDGLQIYAGGEQRGVTVVDSVVGPGWMQGLLLGNPYRGEGEDRDFATVHDVAVRNSLFYGSGNSNIADNSEPSVPPTNWRIENVTSDRPADGKWHNLSFRGNAAEIAIVDSLLSGGLEAAVPEGGTYSGNFLHKAKGKGVGKVIDALYADPAAQGSAALDADFALVEGSPAAGRGSTVTSARQLLARPAAAADGAASPCGGR